MWKVSCGLFDGGFQMENLRVFGNMVEKLSNDREITHDTLREKLNCNVDVLYGLLKGYIVPTGDQLNKLAEIFKVKPDLLLAGDKEYYEESVVHCMHKFTSSSNREELLDIIENYATLASVVE